MGQQIQVVVLLYNVSTLFLFAPFHSRDQQKMAEILVEQKFLKRKRLST